MSENLAKELGKSIVEAKRRPEIKKLLRPEIWEAARKAYAAGYSHPLPNFPVVIGDGTAITDPKQLQETIGRSSLPEALQTTTIFEYEGYDEPTRDICVCSITMDENDILRKKAELEDGPAVLFEEGRRIPHRVLSLKPSTTTPREEI